MEYVWSTLGETMENRDRKTPTQSRKSLCNVGVAPSHIYHQLNNKGRIIIGEKNVSNEIRNPAIVHARFHLADFFSNSRK